MLWKTTRKFGNSLQETKGVLDTSINKAFATVSSLGKVLDKSIECQATFDAEPLNIRGTRVLSPGERMEGGTAPPSDGSSTTKHESSQNAAICGKTEGPPFA